MFRLDSIVPWGRSFAEYIEMFDIAAAEMEGRILDCAGGPSSFAAETHRQGKWVISCDPIYHFSRKEIAQRISDTYENMVAGAEAQKERFNWKRFGSPDDLGRTRMEAMQLFLEDFPNGRKVGRYVTAELPFLPYSEAAFSLALCSHLLFTYSDQLSTDMHLASIAEMCRVAAEVRIFPLVTQFSGEPSQHLGPVTDQLTRLGYHFQIKSVAYEFQKGGNQVLCVTGHRHHRNAESRTIS